MNKTDCWEWYGYLKPNGYASTSFKNKTTYVHRLLYETLVRPIPTGLVIDHLCRNKSCVNPSHLEVVTQGENVRRGQAGSFKQRYCKRGHELKDPNLIHYKHSKKRKCKTCTYADDKMRRLKKRGIIKTIDAILAESKS